MSIAHYIKEIGRGKEGARPLSTEQAHDLFSQVLDGHVTDLEIGAFCLAMRIKGETADELAGFVQATHERCAPLPAPGPGGVVVLPSYNGARKLPNLTALLAEHLARQGRCVLVHGPRQDPSRVTTAEVAQALGWNACNDGEAVAAAWSAGRPAFTDIDTLCPGLARLLAVRWTVGLRNPAHTVAKLLAPWVPGTPTARVINHTHPEYALSLTDYLERTGGTALLMRGTEGEPVADVRRLPRLDVFMRGQRHESLCRSAQDGVLTHVPALPARDAVQTAEWIREVLDQPDALPEPLRVQADTLMALLDRQSDAGAIVVNGAPAM